MLINFFVNNSVIDQSCELSNDGLLGCRIVWVRLEKWNWVDKKIFRQFCKFLKFLSLKRWRTYQIKYFPKNNKGNDLGSVNPLIYANVFLSRTLPPPSYISKRARFFRRSRRSSPLVARKQKSRPLTFLL